MSFSPAGGNWTTEVVDTKAVTTYTQGMMIYNDATDNVPTADATQQNVKGIVKASVASAATTAKLHLLVPADNRATLYADLDSGETIAADDVGKQFDFSAGGLTISTASTYDAVTLVKYVNTGYGVFKLNLTTGIEN
jgi:hypothetical protein